MKILGPKETGRGILIEYDAGHISPEENQKILKEAMDLDYSKDLIKISSSFEDKELIIENIKLKNVDS